jgi:hypothetical protein
MKIRGTFSHPQRLTDQVAQPTISLKGIRQIA